MDAHGHLDHDVWGGDGDFYPNSRSDADPNPEFNNFTDVHGYAKPDLDGNTHPILDRHFHAH